MKCGIVYNPCANDARNINRQVCPEAFRYPTLVFLAKCFNTKVEKEDQVFFFLLLIDVQVSFEVPGLPEHVSVIVTDIWDSRVLPFTSLAYL